VHVDADRGRVESAQQIFVLDGRERVGEAVGGRI